MLDPGPMAAIKNAVLRPPDDDRTMTQAGLPCLPALRSVRKLSASGFVKSHIAGLSASTPPETRRCLTWQTTAAA